MTHATPLAEIIPEFADRVEILANLLYLIKLDAADPQKVKAYAEMADEPLRLLAQVIRRDLAVAGNCPKPIGKHPLPMLLAS